MPPGSNPNDLQQLLHLVISNVCYFWLPRLTAMAEPPEMQKDSTVYLTIIISLALHKILQAISSFQKMLWRLIAPQTATIPRGPPSSPSQPPFHILSSRDRGTLHLGDVSDLFIQGSFKVTLLINLSQTADL